MNPIKSKKKDQASYEKKRHYICSFLDHFSHIEIAITLLLSMILNIIIADQLDALRSPSIRLSITGYISIKHHILRLVNTIHRPSGQTRIQPLVKPIRIQIMHKSDPTLAHEIRKFGEGGRFVCKGRDGVT